MAAVPLGCGLLRFEFTSQQAVCLQQSRQSQHSKAGSGFPQKVTPVRELFVASAVMTHGERLALENCLATVLRPLITGNTETDPPEGNAAGIDRLWRTPRKENVRFRSAGRNRFSPPASWCDAGGAPDMLCVDSPDMRPPEPADVPRLASLMLRAYTGTADDEGENEAQALVEVENTFAGGYGSFVRDCSRVIERNGMLASAVLITRWENRAFVAFTMTQPEYKRQGLCRVCMISAMNALAAEGEEEVWLAVTLANTPAIALYQSLGFVLQCHPPAPGEAALQST
jgi:ribosomal protein S18 acetylase RimI-like enzyme